MRGFPLIKAELVRRLIVLLGIALSAPLAGCSAPPVTPSDYPNFGEVKASFAAGQDVQAITIRALDRLPLTAAVLVLPTGDRIIADSLDQLRDPKLSNQMGLGAPSGDVLAVGGFMPRLTGPGQPEATTQFIGQIASVALIHIPDLAAYKEQYPAAKIEIRLGFAPDERVETLPAPQPL
jgi:hypothetical protein